MDVLGIVSNSVSLVVGLLAIALSVYFYTQAKNTEKSVAITLEGIKAQTETLQKISGRSLDRLTKYVTNPRPHEEQYIQIIAELKNLPFSILSGIRTPDIQPDFEKDKNLVVCYVALYYYTGLANYWVQQGLPPIEKFEENPEYSKLVKQLVDMSYTDFSSMTELLQQIDATWVEKTGMAHLLEEAIEVWRPRVMDSTTAYAHREE